MENWKRKKKIDRDTTNDIGELLQPFQVTYRNGRVENFSTEATSPWSTNIKRSIAGILQLDLSNLGKETAFHSLEVSDHRLYKHFLIIFMLSFLLS